MKELLGFVMGNPQRERVLQILGSRGDLSAERIGKIEHIPAQGVRRILGELSEKDLVFQAGEEWCLTDKGREIEKEIKRRG